MPTEAPPRRTQAERSEATRSALLDATVACLIEQGYAATTTTRVAERAGLSRGAHLHHFQTRAGLVAAAVAHLGSLIADDYDERVAALPAGGSRDARALDLLWDAFSSPLFVAAVELWEVARTDEDLAEALSPVEHELDRRTMESCRQLFPDHAARPDFDELAGFLLSSVRGLALLNVLRPSRGGAAKRWPYARRQLVALLQGTEPA